ncbi:MAG TPA: GIY-YIG nuclease family protein [Spirochaetota bacterium]|nr:GIY-YIG nuclease family protein [Spirochaetota bacterium]
MAKCKKCGKGGIFFKVNSNGICKDCERITNLQMEEETLREKFLNTEKSYNEIKNKRDSLYIEISEKAKKDALFQITAEIDKKNSELESIILKIEEKQKLFESISVEYNQSQKTILSNANKLRNIQTLFKSMQYSTKRYFDEESFSKEILTENLPVESEELLSTTVTLKLHLMDIRELRKLYNQNNKIIQELLLKYQGRYTTKANITIYKLMVIALESELQNVLYNMSYSKLDKAIKDIKTITSKYLKIATDGNQSIATTVTKFIGEIEYLFIEAIKIEYEYYIQKERIKEEQKAIRDQMRQEAAERKILEEERKKVEQEETKYENEIMNIKEQLSKTDDKLKIKQFEERIAKIQSQLEEVEKKKESIINLQNGQAGYIYVISNFGSFGENIFKVGMTRRMNPQDRIDELGDASVPFKFDVHSLIFSNKAPELENSLHKQLNNKRVNKVNLRKEFFYTTIDELEDLVYSLEPSAEFNRTMLAEQYYQSMGVNEVPENVRIIEDENIDEDDE